LPDFDRLYRWLIGGALTAGEPEGIVTLNTGDRAGNSYECRIWPGFIPEPPEQIDRGVIEYRVTLQLLHIVPIRMICSYDVAITAES
jgi:hypothetical protein